MPLTSQCWTPRPSYLCCAVLLLLCDGMRAAVLFKLIQAVRKPPPISTGGSLRIAIVGSGYAGLACGYFGCNVADTVTIFGLEDSPGVQTSSSASTISAGLLHPLTPRGKVMYRGEEGFAETVALLTKVQQHTNEEVFERYPFHQPPLGDNIVAGSQEKEEGMHIPIDTLNQPITDKPLRALLRPLFRDSDLQNWSKASVTNTKWVGMLSQGEIDSFYERGGQGQSSSVEGDDESSAVVSASTSSSGAGAMDMDSSDTSIDSSSSSSSSSGDSSEGGGVLVDDEEGTSHMTVVAKLLGAAVIKNAIVVDSAAYLKGLWSLISSQSSEENAKEGAEGAKEGKEGVGRVRSYTYEKRIVTMHDVAQLSREYDVVIIASGAGTQKMWSEEDILPFAYVRGQNVELSNDREGSEGEVEGGKEGGGEGVEVEGGGKGLESVLLAGEYIVPRRRNIADSAPQASVDSNSDSSSRDIKGPLDSNSNSNNRVSDKSVQRKQRKTLLIGGTHEHCLTMQELEAPPDLEKASSLLMAKMLSMYPALEEEGWRSETCYAGIRVVPPRSHLGRLPVAGKHLKLDNVWLIGGLGSRGLLYHSLLAQLVIQEAIKGGKGVEGEGAEGEEGVKGEGLKGGKVEEGKDGKEEVKREEVGGRGRRKRRGRREGVKGEERREGRLEYVKSE